MSLKKTASKKKDDVDDGTPRWMDSDYDESHKAEIEPLFGTGKVALQGEGDEEGDIESKSVNVSYGSVAPSSEDDDSDDDDDDDEEEMVVEEKPKVLLKSVAKPTTNTASRKLRNLLTATKSKTSSSTTKTKKKVREIVITERGKPEMPRPSCLVACFKFIEGFCIIVCMGLLASQIIPFFFIPLEELGLANACLKFYISLFCILFALVEGNVPIGPIRDASFLQTYVSFFFGVGEPHNREKWVFFFPSFDEVSGRFCREINGSCPK